jgi:hypothetical protein
MQTDFLQQKNALFLNNLPNKIAKQEICSWKVGGGRLQPTLPHVSFIG